MDKAKLIQTCKQIAEDTRNDVNEFHGKEFNGKTVGDFFGKISASIYVLSLILTEILENEEKSSGELIREDLTAQYSRKKNENEKP